MAPGKIRSPLGRHASRWREPDPQAAKAAARDAWHATGVILINPQWLSSWTDQKQAELLAEKLFGKRKDTK